MANLQDPMNLTITGVGGQGTIFMSRLIARVFIEKGYYVTTQDDVGVAQRSGAVQSTVRVSKTRVYSPMVPEGRGHVIVGLEPLETLRRLGKYGNPEITTITNFRPLFPTAVLTRREEYPDFDALRDAIQKLSKKAFFLDASSIALDIGASVLTNTVMLGVLVSSKTFPLEFSDVEQQMKNSVPEELLVFNLKALEAGMKAIADAQRVVE